MRPHSFQRLCRGTHGGATAIVAGVIAIMTIVGGGLLIDQAWLVSQRDLLKSAADAASVAATLRLRNLPSSLSDADVETDLRAVAKRYVELNVEAHERSDPPDLTLKLDINRNAGLVGVEVTDPGLGRTLMEAFHGYVGLDSITVSSGADLDLAAVRAVLALDVSRSMKLNLRGNVAKGGDSPRIDIVKDAVDDFLDAVPPSADKGVSIGLVTWAQAVFANLPPRDTRTEFDQYMKHMKPIGSHTASTLGLVRAQKLLKSAPDEVQKIIVLLTDGEDNRGPKGGNCITAAVKCGELRKRECTKAKEAGITLYTVAAMHPHQVSGKLGRELRECATSEEHAFLNHRNAQALRDTFGQIGGRIQSVRRTY